MDTLESEVNAGSKMYVGAGQPLPGIDLQEGEKFLNEMRNHTNGAPPNSGSIQQNIYEFDEMMRKEYIEGLSESSLFKAVRMLYMRLTNKGANDILKRGVGEFDVIIKENEAERERLKARISEEYSSLYEIHDRMAKKAEEIKKAENGILYISNKQSELERLMFSKREGSSARDEMSFAYLSGEYRDKPMHLLSRESSELKLMDELARDELNPLYADVIALNEDYKSVESNSKYLRAQARQKSDEITELHRNKARINTGLIKIMNEQLESAKLAERSGKVVNSNLAMSAAAKRFMANNYHSLFSRMSMNIENKSEWESADKRLKSQVDDYCERNQVGSEDTKTGARAILYERGML